MRSQLENCLSEGVPLLVTDCDVNALMHDQRFISVILNRAKFVKGRNPFKIWVCLLSRKICTSKDYDKIF